MDIREHDELLFSQESSRIKTSLVIESMRKAHRKIPDGFGAPTPKSGWLLASDFQSPSLTQAFLDLVDFPLILPFALPFSCAWLPT